MKEHLVKSNITCPNCESSKVNTKLILDKFKYGTGQKAVELEAVVPLLICSNCEFEYTDYRADDSRHDEVCKYLGVMTPSEIIAIRRRYGMTRSGFAEITKIGEASLSRWETGEVIQNASNDNYLHLLTFPENLNRLRNKVDDEIIGASEIGYIPDTPRFKMLSEHSLEEKKLESACFSL